MTDAPATPPSPVPHRRRPRYAGKYPRKFHEKYKEHDPVHHAETFAKVLASGKTPAGTHRPIMVEEVIGTLDPAPGEIAVDCTLGYGGHTRALLEHLLPGGRVLGIDADPIELARSEGRFREQGFGPELLSVYRSNFAGLPSVLAEAGLSGADIILADLGVSSMQLDDPSRGFGAREDGPLDMRMNPARGQPAAELLARLSSEALEDLLKENADEPHAVLLARALAGQRPRTTRDLSLAIQSALRRSARADVELSIRRTFQALRIAVNDEFGALNALLRHLPTCLNPGGRAAILSFHSGEDRRVKKAFQSGLRDGLYEAISAEPIRPGQEERRANPRSSSAKLRWARRSRDSASQAQS